MSTRALFVFALLLAVHTALGARKKTLPPYLKVCKRSDSTLEKCVASAIETLRPYLKKGIPEIGVPPCEPMFIPEVIIHQGHGAISMETNYSNIQVSGPSQFQLKTVRLDFDHNILLVRMRLPSLSLVSNYTMKGHFLMLPVGGKGISYSNYTDIDVTASIQSNRFVKDGKAYWNVHDFFMDFDIGDASIRLEDLFAGHSELGESINRFLNESWRSIADEIKPSLEKTIGDLFKQIANNIFHRYSTDELLPK